jgi:hypothetical protein
VGSFSSAAQRSSSSSSSSSRRDRENISSPRRQMDRLPCCRMLATFWMFAVASILLA